MKIKVREQGQRFSTRLVLGLFVLTLLTTLSAGVPAYWLTRRQLEQQAWSNVADARQATLALLNAEQARLLNLATLFAERPTLQRIVREQTLTQLPAYLQDFQEQSALPILVLCGMDGRPLAGSLELPHCPLPAETGFTLINGQPALLVHRVVQSSSDGQAMGSALTGIWLDAAFLQRLVDETGVQQSLVLPDGNRLISTIAGAEQLPPLPAEKVQQISQGQVLQQALTLGNENFYATYASLSSQAAQQPFLLEVALAVNELIGAETRALIILVASTGLVALGGMALAAWYISRLTKPLWQLSQVAQQISHGNFMAPIPAFSTPREVATLSAAFIRSQAAMLHSLEEQSQARDWLNLLIQSIVEGVITLDASGCITFMSQGAEALSGWQNADAVGQPIHRIFALANPGAGQLLEELPRPGSKRQIDIRTHTGRVLTLAMTAARLASTNGENNQLALVLRDVTHEEAIRNLRAYFLANISHEFQTPLSTLSASIELLLDSGEEYSLAEIRELLKPAYLSLLGLQNLVNNLLQSSSIEAGHFTIRKEPTDLAPIVSAARQLVQPLLDRRQQPLLLLVPEHLPEIEADPTRLTQVFANLLTNASKYSPIGAAIELQVEQKADTLRVAVADRGAGIPPAERQNLFQRFVRLDTQSHEQYGIGLGLYVVKTTVELHGGQVGIDERPGGGSIFWFTLPLSADGKMIHG